MTAAAQVITVRAPADIAQAYRLFKAYAASLEVDLSYQGFAAELAGLPGDYAPPGGALLLAKDANGEALGCVALRRLAPVGVCEMKRLYVVDAARGRGVGGVLISAVVSIAKDLGYREMRLDTLPTMTSALDLYRQAGFQPIAPYYDTPIAGTVFLGLRLAG